MNVDMTMFHQAFFDEMADLLNDLEGYLLRIEETPDDSELLNSIFRCAHSIKGGSATFGFAQIAEFTHGLETLLDRVRNGQAPVTCALIQLLLESLDQLRAFLEVACGPSPAAPDAAGLRARIHAMISGAVAETAITPPSVSKRPGKEREQTAESWGVWALPSRYRLQLYPGADTFRQGTDLMLLLKHVLQAGEIASIACDTSHVPPLAELDPETCYLGWEIELRTDWEEKRLLDIFEFIADESRITLTLIEPVAEEQSETIFEDLPKADPICAKEPPALRSEDPMESATPERSRMAANTSPLTAVSKSESQTLRVSTDKVDKLINLVGELIINQSMLNEVLQDFTMAKLPRLKEAVAEMERASRELQERVMAVRMLPIRHAFGRFPRLVHDLAASVGKKIDLKTSGEDTELDKTVIEAIADPLTHLIRNSIDHGLESPRERLEAGKPELGTVALHAFHEGGSIVIEVSDDGRGLDRDLIYRKALDRGLLSENDPMPSDEALYQYIFHAGFSTAQKVTDLSGRGVGMDIVKQAMQGLGGSITLSSVIGQGTRFRIRLPLTMAILEGLSLSVGSEVYILPLTSIVESIRPRSGDVRQIAGQTEVAIVRGEVLPVLRLYHLFGAKPFITDPTQGLLVIVENDGHKVALMVDELIGQSQVVIKSLETNYRKVDGIAGATILGDGRVALIVDVPGLIRGASSGSSFSAAA